MHTRVKRFVRNLFLLLLAMAWMLGITWARNNSDYAFIGLVMVVPAVAGFIAGETDDTHNDTNYSDNEEEPPTNYKSRRKANGNSQ